MSDLRKTITDIRRKQYEGTSDAAFISGDVAPGRIREQVDAANDPDQDHGTEENDADADD